MANVKLAQIFQTSVSSVFEQFRLRDTGGENYLLNRTLGITKAEFENIMDGQAVPFSSTQGLSYEFFTALDWMMFTDEQWYYLTGRPTFVPTKSSLYLRAAGFAGEAFEVDTSAVIDMTNHAGHSHGELFVAIDDDGTGGGSMAVFSEDDSTSLVSDLPALDYPLVFLRDRLYTLYFRVKAEGGQAAFQIDIDGQTVEAVAEAVTPGTWSWVSATLLLPDRDAHTLSVRPTRAGQKFDKLVVQTSGAAPTGVGPDYSPSPYATVHVRLYETASQLPSSPIYSYDAKATCDGVSGDGWYNFDTSEKWRTSTTAAGELAVVVSVSGGNDGHFVTWEVSTASETMPSAAWDGAQWVGEEAVNYAVLLYSDRVPLSGCGVVARPAQEFDLRVRNFYSEDAKFLNTRLDGDEYTDAYGRVVLDLPAKVVTFVVDQSGSASWNDPEGARHKIVRRIATRLKAYPQDVKFNLLSFGSTPVTPVLFASKSQYSGDDPEQVAREHFKAANTRIAGVRLLRKKGGYPQSPIDGEILKDGIFSRYRDEGLDEGEDYYYALYTYRWAGDPATTLPVFSEGVKFKATPRAKDAPRGISSLTARTMTGTGVVVDAGTMAAWHMDEGDGDSVHDFSDSNVTLTSSSAYWLNQTDVPVGRSGLRFNGTDTDFHSDATTACALRDTFTFAAWVYAYDGYGPLLTRESSGGAANDYQIAINALGQVTLKLGGNALRTATSTAVAPFEWHHVTVTVDLTGHAAKFYVDGVLAQTVTLSESAVSVTAMVMSLGTNASHSSRFFGRMTEVSLHDRVLSDAEIAALAQPVADAVQDNGDRVVLFDWFMAEASEGEVVIVENLAHAPANADDGEVVYSGAKTAGRHSASRARRFRANVAYHYRVFVKNGEGNYSLFEDSSSASVTIPRFTEGAAAPVLSSALPPVTQFTVSPMDSRTLLRWSLPDDDRLTGVKIYWSYDGPPAVDEDGSTGVLVADLDRSVTEFVHTLSQNGRESFYAVVATDNAGQVSATAIESATPDADADLLPPLPEVSAARYELANETTVEIVWENPQEFIAGVDAYYGEPVYVYGYLADAYGNPLTGLEGASFSPTFTYQTVGVDDVFGDTADGVSDASLRRLWSLSSTATGEGMVRGGLRFDGRDPSINAIASARFDVTLLDGAGYESSPVVVTYRNPLGISVENVNGDTVAVRTRGTDGAFTSEFFDGAYARRDSSILLRLSVSYRGLPLSPTTVSVRQRVSVGGIATLSDVTDRAIDTASFDVSVPVPDAPNVTEFFVRVASDGYAKSVALPLHFVSPLQVEITPNAPRNDGHHVAEQSALVYYVDPNDATTVTAVPFPTVVRWTISGGTSDAQPFYSTDNVRLPNGVYSFVRDGTARKCFVGPVSGIDPRAGDTFSLTATVVYDGLVAQDVVPLKIKAAGEEEFTGSRFLAEFPAVVNELWADGSDYVKMTIVHDPTAVGATGTFLACFNDCSAQFGNEIVPLDAGQLVQISVGNGYEILWGDVEEVAVDGRAALDASNASAAVGEATVPLSSGDATEVYFRLNKTNLSTQTTLRQPSDSPCDCFKMKDTFSAYSSAVTLSGVALLGGEARPLRAGGDGRDGFPPLVISPLEPLDIRVVDVRVDGYPSDVFVVDGTTKNEIVFEVSWRGEPVPDGTVVSFDFVAGADAGTNEDALSLDLEAQSALTVQSIDPYLNPNGPTRSFVRVKVLPQNPSIPFAAHLRGKVSYDEGGQVARTAQSLVSIYYVLGTKVGTRGAVVFGGELFRYSPSSSTWSTLAQMGYPRGAVTLASVGSSLYAIGGTDGRTVSQFVEEFDGTSWTLRSDMPTPRAYPMSVVDGGKVYVFGGIAVDGISERLVVSRSAEVYDPSADSWTTLASMPTIDMGLGDEESYGVAMGAVAVSGGKIYVACGVREVDGVDRVTAYNDRVLVYDIAGNSWSYSDVLTGDLLTSYERVAPFCSVVGSDLWIAGGATESTYKADALAMTLASSAALSAASLVWGDGLAENLPFKRYKGGSVSIGDDAYFLGGMTSSFPTSNLVEAFDTSSGTLVPGSAVDMPVGMHSFGVATDGTDVFVAGGISGGRDERFLQIGIDVGGRTDLSLDGRQSLTMEVTAVDRNGDVPSGVSIAVYGTIPSHPNEPVLLSDGSVTLSGAPETVVILPRSFDLVGDDSSYQIDVHAVVLDESYDGNTSVEFPPSEPVGGGVETGDFVRIAGSVEKPTGTRGVFFNFAKQGQSVFDLLPPVLPSGVAKSIVATSEVVSVPAIRTILGDNEATADELIAAVDELSEEVPFGVSPVYDALGGAISVMSTDAVADSSKTIYFLSDGDENTSSSAEEDVAKDLVALAGSDPSPLVAVDLSLHSPLRESSSVLSGNDLALERLAVASGGQTIAAISADLDGVVTDATGRLLGSLGFGTFEYTVDIREKALLTSLELTFDVTDNSSVSWQYAISDDGFEYSDWSESFGSEDVPEFSGVTARYLKFLVAMSSGLTVLNTEAGESGAAAQSPSLDQIKIVFSKVMSDYLFMEVRRLDGAADDLVVAVNADRPEGTEIEVGASTSLSHNWDHFQSGAMSAEDQNGKMVIPYRVYSPQGASAKEGLESLDGYLFKAKYGRWNPSAVVSVYDSTGAVVPADKYGTYPDSGVVVFRERRTGGHFISVADSDLLRLGMRVTSRSGDASVAVRAAGVMYTKR